MITSLLLTVALAETAAPQVEPLAGLGPVPGLSVATVSWDELCARYFDTRWCLPDDRRAGGRDLLQEMDALVTTRFKIRDQDGTLYRSFGDLAQAASGMAPGARAAWLDRLARRAPDVFNVWGWPLRELLLDDQLFSGDWEPDEDLPRDGFFAIDAWDLADEGTAPWNDVRVGVNAEQGAVLIRADAQTIKDVENDYRHYLSDVGATYEALRPVRQSFVRGEDPKGDPFSSLRLFIRCDLPWPYTVYTLDLGILNRIDDEGRLVTDVYSTSDDFYWLAGRDVFLPVTTTDGDYVGQLVVRVYGFDLRGVPDARKHRRAALRSSLGNLRRKVEPLYGKRGRPAPDLDATPLPEFSVYGG